jgi:hypothetical protein
MLINAPKMAKLIYDDFLENLGDKILLDLAAFNRAVHGGFIVAISRSNAVY